MKKLYFFYLILFFNCLLFANPHCRFDDAVANGEISIYPKNWWVGMKESTSSSDDTWEIFWD